MPKLHRVRTAGFAALALAPAVLLAACSSDAAVNKVVPADAGLVVQARDNIFDKKDYAATAGAVKVAYENKGNTTHNLEIEGVSGFKMSSTPGEVGVATIQLVKGTYKIFCSIPGHRDAGMQATLTVG
jgi:plastocyanin